VWGLFGGYEYLSPQVFRVASTSLTLGTVAQWWLTRTLALQGIGYLVSARNAHAPDGSDRHQLVQTVTLSYNFLGHTHFGAVERRPAEMPFR